MARWTFEPGHTSAEFRARHMMVTWVRGLFTDIHGWVDFDWDDWTNARFEGVIDATRLFTGVPDRDAHLKNTDFLDVANHPTITFSGRVIERTGSTHFKAATDLTIRGATRTVAMDVVYLGEWETPFWLGTENKGTLRRAGFEGNTRINRHDFGVSWQAELPRGGLTVSNEIDVHLDAEAILDEDLERTGAVEYYRQRPRH